MTTSPELQSFSNLKQMKLLANSFWMLKNNETSSLQQIEVTLHSHSNPHPTNVEPFGIHHLKHFSWSENKLSKP